MLLRTTYCTSLKNNKFTLMHIFVSNYKGQCNNTDIYYGSESDNLKWRSSSFGPKTSFPNFDSSNDIFSYKTGHWALTSERKENPWITFANSLNPDYDQQEIFPDLDPNCLTL